MLSERPAGRQVRIRNTRWATPPVRDGIPGAWGEAPASPSRTGTTGPGRSVSTGLAEILEPVRLRSASAQAPIPATVRSRERRGRPRSGWRPPGPAIDEVQAIRCLFTAETSASSSISRSVATSTVGANPSGVARAASAASSSA